MFKKLLCGFLAMTMVYGLGSCDKSEEKETKVDGNQVLGLVMTDVMTWDMTKGIEINGNVNTKLGTYTKSGGFNLKVAMNALTSEPIYEMHVNDAFGVDFDAYIDSTASYIALGDLKVLVPVTTSDDTLTSYASDPSSDPFAELVAQFDFYKLSDTSYYMTAKKEFLTTVNLYLPTLMEQILPFLNVTLNELRIDFQLTKDQHLSKVALKVGTTLGIDDKEINAEFSGNLSVNKEDAMPAVPTDAASYLSVEQIIGQLFQEPITGSVELAIALGELNEILALDISFAVDMEIGYPSITIDVNEKTTINILELAGIPDVVLKKITIAYDEEVSGLAITLYDDKNNVIVSMPLSSSSENPSDDSNGNTPLYAESTTTIEMEIAKDIIKAMFFDFTLEEEEGKLTCVALDGFRMAVTRELMKIAENNNIIISAKILNEINKIISESDGEEDIKI